MSEADDRLSGDLVWELFPVQSTGTRSRRLLHALEASLLVVLTWFVSPSLSVAIACLSISLKDFRDGWRLARSIPDKEGGTICVLFTYSWGAWKLSAAAFTVFVVGAMNITILKQQTLPSWALMALLLFTLGLLTSTLLTATGLFKALRSKMRVWIGEGMNQARTLLLVLLIEVFTLCVLISLIAAVIAGVPGLGEDPRSTPFGWFGLLGFLGGMWWGSAFILLGLDWIAGRVLAKEPGKFGAKSPTLGK